MSRSISLKNLIYKSFLVSSMIPIFVIELVLIILYFGASSYITNESRKTLYESVSQNLHEITLREAQKISYYFQEVSRTAVIMRQNHEDYFTSEEACFLPNAKPEFAVHENGAYYKTKDNGGATLYYVASTQKTPEAIRKALCTEFMDPLLKSIVNTNPIITQAYFNTWDGLSRLYPFMEDSPSQYGPSVNMEDYNFYYLANKKHNPEKKSVWTSAYLDPAGQGWMISRIMPIYKKDFLEGVSGLDVTIDTIIKNILSLDIPWNGSAFLVDSDGMILAMPQEVENLFELKELREHLYSESIKSTIEKPQEYNLFKIKNPQLQKQMTDFFQSNNEFGNIQSGDTNYILSQEIIPETGWRFIVLVDEASVYEPIVVLKEETYWIGYIVIGLMVGFYLVFFAYLLRKSSIIASKIALPIQELTLLTSGLGHKADNFIQNEVGIEEVDLLTQNFNKVSRELDARTKEYVEVQLREKVREKDAEIAYKAGLFESASSYLHNIGNTLTMIDSKILSIRHVKKALEKSGFGFTKLLGLVEKSDANEKQKEELSTFLHLFDKALAKDVTQELGDIADNIENINKHASISIHYQQDLFNSSNDLKKNYTQNFDVKCMLEELVKDYKNTFNKKEVNFHLDCEENLMLNSIKFQFHSGLSNVLKNALESIMMNQNIEVGELFIRAFRKADNIIVEIQDNGVGIKPENASKVLQSGFTTKKNGHGLGLHSFNNFLNRNNGKISLKSDGHLQGATLYIIIGDNDVE